MCNRNCKLRLQSCVMDRTLTVRTPESIAFSYELAGLGSRFLAVLADLAIQLMLLALVIWGIVALGSHAPRTPLPAAEEKWASLRRSR